MLYMNAAAAQTDFAEINQKAIQSASGLHDNGLADLQESIDYYTGQLHLSQTDLVSRGIGPDIIVSRRYKPHFSLPGIATTPIDWGSTYDAADWELDIPRMEVLLPINNYPYGTTPVGAVFNRVAEWKVDAPDPYSRCTNYNKIPRLSYLNGGTIILAEEWWTGLRIVLPGQSAQEVLWRSEQNTVTPSMSIGGVQKAFNLTTDKNWMITCLPTLKNNYPGEGFLLLDNNGTKYFFDWVAFEGLVPMSTFERGTHQGNLALYNRIVRATRMRLLVSRIQDRFGNYVDYKYDNNKLIEISASDGRKIAFSWIDRPWGGNNSPATNVYSDPYHHLSQMKEQPGTASERTWSFQYELETHGTSYRRDARLRRVVQPDGTSWLYRLDRWARGCTYLHKGHPAYDAGLTYDCAHTLPMASSVTSPSGATVNYEFATFNRRRFAATAPTTEELFFDYNYMQGIMLVKKTLSGPGVSSVWTFSITGNNVPQTVHRTIEPGGAVQDITINANYRNLLEGKIVSVRRYRSVSDPTVISATDFEYALPDGQPYPARIGHSLQRWKTPSVERYLPMKRRTTWQDGVSYRYEVLEYDYFAREKTVKKSSVIE